MQRSIPVSASVFSTDALLEVEADYVGPVVYEKNLPYQRGIISFQRMMHDTIALPWRFGRPLTGPTKRNIECCGILRGEEATVPRVAIKKVFLSAVEAGRRSAPLLEARDSLLPQVPFYRCRQRVISNST